MEAGLSGIAALLCAARCVGNFRQRPILPCNLHASMRGARPIMVNSAQSHASHASALDWLHRVSVSARLASP